MPLLTSDLLVSKHRYRIPVVLPSLNLFSLEAFCLCLIMILIWFKVVCAKTIVLYAIHTTRFFNLSHPAFKLCRRFNRLPGSGSKSSMEIHIPQSESASQNDLRLVGIRICQTSRFRTKFYQCMMRQEFIFYIYFIFCQSYIKAFSSDRYPYKWSTVCRIITEK